MHSLPLHRRCIAAASPLHRCCTRRCTHAAAHGATAASTLLPTPSCLHPPASTHPPPPTLLPPPSCLHPPASILVQFARPGAPYENDGDPYEGGARGINDYVKSLEFPPDSPWRVNRG